MDLQAERLNPYKGRDIPWLLSTQEQAHGPKLFFVWEPRQGDSVEYTYSDFASRVRQVANGLQQRGVSLGDRVLIHMENSPEFLFAWFACALIGAVAVTTNTKSSGAELEYFAEHAAVVGAITQPSFYDLVSKSAASARWTICTADDGGVAPKVSVNVDAAGRFDSLYGDDSWTPRPHDEQLPLFVQYTSGTTARPKGVVWTHANGLWGAQVAARHEDLRDTDRHLVYLPLFHVNALVYSVLTTLWVGCSAVLTNGFSSSRFWDISLKHKCTWASMIPFAVRSLLGQEVPKDHSYRLWGFGRCDPQVEGLFRVRTIGWWGMTETISHGIIGDTGPANEPLSIGRPAVEYEISIRHEDGSVNVPGQVGELVVRGMPGVSLFKEYLNDPDATAKSFDDEGWFHTGDNVYVSENGGVFWVDRGKDMLKVGGENVAAFEVEAAMVGVPGAAETAVVGKRDDLLDEVPVVFVIPTDPNGDHAAMATALVEACKKSLATFKVPREVYIVSELPRSTLEKVAKPELRRQVEEGVAVNVLPA